MLIFFRAGIFCCCLSLLGLLGCSHGTGGGRGEAKRLLATADGWSLFENAPKNVDESRVNFLAQSRMGNEDIAPYLVMIAHEEAKRNDTGGKRTYLLGIKDDEWFLGRSDLRSQGGEIVIKDPASGKDGVFLVSELKRLLVKRD